jgi:hypothetical protein
MPQIHVLAPSLSLVFASALHAQSKLYDWSGGTASENVAITVRGAADLDGDARGDVLVGLPYKNVGSVVQAGRVEVRSGATGLLLRTHEDGALPGDRFGDSVCSLGDVDGDGRGDYAVGMPQIHDSAADPHYAQPGAVRVYSGASGALLWAQSGAFAQQRYGADVSAAGDWNGDGVPDLLVGAPGSGPASPANSHVHVRSGSTGALLADLSYFHPQDIYAHWVGAVVSGVGDLDLDGSVDAIASDAVMQLVRWSGATGASAFVETRYPCPFASCAGTVTNNFTSLAWAGDYNGDGYQDFAEGTTWTKHIASSGGGSVRVYSGATNGTLAIIDKQASYDATGHAVAGLGDVNGDGYGDLLVGAPGNHPIGLTAGEVRVYAGHTKALLYELPWPPQPCCGGQGYGSSVSLADDMNGDGRSDFLVGWSGSSHGASAYSTVPLALTADVHVLSAASGGAQAFALASAPHAGQLYLVAATGSGMLPGTLVDGVLVPLNVDAFTLFALQSLNQAPYAQTLGVLGATGGASASLTLPPGAASGVVGTTLHHAFIVVNGTVGFASNAVPLTIVP